MFEENSFPYMHTSGVRYPNFLTPVVFTRVLNVETSLSVSPLCPLLLDIIYISTVVPSGAYGLLHCSHVSLTDAKKLILWVPLSICECDSIDTPLDVGFDTIAA